MNIKITPNLRGELLRFILFGVGTMIVCLASMWVLVACAGLSRIISLNIAAGIGYLYAYITNKSFVFRKNEHTHLFYGSRFIILQMVLLFLNNSLFYIGVYLLEFHYLLVNFTIAVFLTIINFIIMKVTVFK